MTLIYKNTFFSGCSPKFALFDSQLDKFQLPVIYQSPPLPSVVMGERLVQEKVQPLIEKYFEWVGIFEDGASSQPTDILLFYAR